MAAVEVSGETHVEPTIERLVEASADWIVARICRSLAERDRCAIALSGGTTPGPVYQRVARAGQSGTYDGSRLDLYLADERCVPIDDAESNARLVRESWLAIDAGPTLHMPQGDGGDFVADAQRYAQLVPARFDLVVLGIGPDGHTASLFPGPDVDLDARAHVVFVADAPKPPPQRWSLSATAIRDARSLVTIVTGSAKADAVQRALEGPWNPSETPAQLARRGAWFLDRDAARQLMGKTQ